MEEVDLVDELLWNVAALGGVPGWIRITGIAVVCGGHGGEYNGRMCGGG